ncbi:MAG: DUF2213 domain-containing protein [Hormoscilla sp. GUM202]|nr:DUF2213 domain-containing protein [Hormoscilla sp. GUM202]
MGSASSAPKRHRRGAIAAIAPSSSGSILSQTTPRSKKSATRVARTGDIRYKNTDGSERTETVSRDTLLDRKSLDSLSMKPIARAHPPKMLDSDKVREHMVGMTSQRIIVDDDFDCRAFEAHY